MTSRDRLTEKQRRLKTEIEQIAAQLRLDYQSIRDYDREERTVRLELIKQQLIRSEIVTSYTLIDELLSSAIARYFFGPFTANRGFTYHWRTKKFQVFNFYILEKLSLLEKLALLRAIRKVPKRVVADIEAINALRNALAHAFFPENLRAYRPGKPRYKGKEIFSFEGVERFLEDAGTVEDFLIRNAVRRPRKPRPQAAVPAPADTPESAQDGT